MVSNFATSIGRVFDSRYGKLLLTPAIVVLSVVAYAVLSPDEFASELNRFFNLSGVLFDILGGI